MIIWAADFIATLPMIAGWFPHFEKMLYDNALLARTYLEAFLATGNGLYRRITEETLDYLVREMRDPSGGFYSTEDADSEGEEGKFYIWSLEEFRRVVGVDSDRLARYFDVSELGNFEGYNILNVSRPPELFAKLEGMIVEDLELRIAEARKRLLEARSRRAKPGRDDKILTDWKQPGAPGTGRRSSVSGPRRLPAGCRVRMPTSC